MLGMEPKFLADWSKSRRDRGLCIIMTDTKKDNVFVLLMLLSKLQVGCKSPFLAKKNLIFMLSVVLHGIVATF